MLPDASPASSASQSTTPVAVGTPYHGVYWAHALTLRGQGDSVGRLSRSISNARVDLNPHQVDAALFALRSPLSKGVILADEVGLGKTIEAGLVISQRWAERRRRILLIVPATLRKQWQQELEEKFFLPAVIFEKGNLKQFKKDGHKTAWDQAQGVIICSYHFASAQMADIKRTPWDLVVIDEAHRLRNVYKPGAKIANNIVEATREANKILLTATPLQNSLMELYGLVSLIDPHVFGDQDSFREQFVRATEEKRRNLELKTRLSKICRRTLRKQVLEYVRFTTRIPMTQDFTPSDEEHQLYEQVSAYLQRKNLHALPAGQRSLMTLVMRKLLASSTFAIAGTLRRLSARLEQKEAGEVNLADEYDPLVELQEEWDDDASAEDSETDSTIAEEIADLKQFADLAESIAENAKGDALLKALETGFEKAAELGAPQKAVIFTESRRTQQYLLELLSQRGYQDQIVLINGTNTDPLSQAIYKKWLERHAGQGTISGSKSADMKAALVEEFRERGTLLLATESAAEGVNLQFCSLVVNYDLPWNPQRIEQRIGRCHRYGQKHDVVVINFLNRRNEADQRVFDLLSIKFKLFDGVFGASDEVLGALESGVDIERSIARLYQECRTAEDIQIEFDKLQAELEQSIQSRMAETKKALLDNFDEDVQSRLKVRREAALSDLSQREKWLLALTKLLLQGEAEFDAEAPRFFYEGPLAPKGYYHLDWKQAEVLGDYFYRVDHPLAVQLIEKAKTQALPPVQMVLDYGAYGRIISAVAPLVGTSGWLEVAKLTVDSLETEEYLVLSGISDTGELIDEDLCQKLLSLPARPETPGGTPQPASALQAQAKNLVALQAHCKSLMEERIGEVEARNGRYYDEEAAKLDRWADDLKLGLQREIEQLGKAIEELRKQGRQPASLQEKVEMQKQQRTLETKRAELRENLYRAEDEIADRRDSLIKDIEEKLRQTHRLDSLFTVRWTIVFTKLESHHSNPAH